MNYTMNVQRSRLNMASGSEHSKTKSGTEKPISSSSDYSTCSDDPQMNMYWNNKQKSELSRESDILAGHIESNQANYDSTLEDTDFYISPLDLNLDVLSSEQDTLGSGKDIYSDCRDFGYHESNDSTLYIQLAQDFNSKENQSDLSNKNSKITNTESKAFPKVTGALPERLLLTIIEEKDITNTTNHIVIKFPNNTNPNDDQLMAEVNDQSKMHEENNSFAKKVLFANMDDKIDNRNNRLESKKNPKSSSSRSGWATSRRANDTCNHNTTESFVLWEKFCETSEKLASRRSFSFSELNAINESCCGDDEYSTSFKTLDDMHSSRSFIERENCSVSNPRKSTIYRSKSCESILREVKHLPHVLYDRFLKCLSEEIERIRKEIVVCTCHKLHKTNSNKENERKRSPKKSTLKLTKKIANIETGETESRSPLQGETYTGKANKTGLLPKPTNSTRLSPTETSRIHLSPEATPKNLSQFLTSPKSPTRTVTPSKSHYFWNKQIVSPVGEYIRGKRQSPFQSSPSKKK